jgi:hypothetical protein
MPGGIAPWSCAEGGGGVAQEHSNAAVNTARQELEALMASPRFDLARER